MTNRPVDDLSEVQDLLPTLIDLCGIEKPASAKFDGTSLAAVLRGTVGANSGRRLRFDENRPVLMVPGGTSTEADTADCIVRSWP